MTYYSFNQYLKKKYKEAVWKVTLEGGFNCPNRDGTKALGGCSFCTADGSSARTQDPKESIEKQLVSGISKQKRRHKAKKFIAYLQSFTNTYGTLEKLKATYQAATSDPGVVILAIGTRPDCLESPVIELINSFTEKVEVWIDLGLQSIHNQTLEKMNRAHTSEEFFLCLERIKREAPQIKICAHMIAGLPPEDRKLELSLQTGLALAKAPIDGLKIHNLCILEKTKTAQDFEQGLIRPLERSEYRNLVIEILTKLNPNISIHRLMGEAPKKEELIAPKWANDKNAFLRNLIETMEQKKLFQGCALLKNQLSLAK